MSESNLKELFAELLEGRTREEMVVIWENMSMMIRAFKGQAVEPKDAIDKLTNVRNIYERSRFPSYPLINLIVYLRLIYQRYGPDAEACKYWAEYLAETLISYKGLSREEYRDILKAASVPEGSSFFFGSQPQQAEKKKPFWQRKPKEEPKEFKE